MSLCSQFPRHEDEHSVTLVEVPAPMVALVATAVSDLISFQVSYLISISCMLRFTSGVLGNTKPRTFRPTPLWMFTRATLTCSTTSGTIAAVNSTQWWLTFIPKQSEYSIVWSVVVITAHTCHSASAPVSAPGVPTAHIDLDKLEGWVFIPTVSVNFPTPCYLIMWFGIGICHTIGQ